MDAQQMLDQANRFQQRIADYMKTSAIWPEFRTDSYREDGKEMTALYTKLRLKREGKYYLQLSVESAFTPMLHSLYGRFIQKCYYVQRLYDIKEPPENVPAAELDPDQTPETERLLKIIDER